MADDVFSTGQIAYLGAYSAQVESEVVATLNGDTGVGSERVALLIEQGDEAVWLNEKQLAGLKRFLNGELF